MRAGSSTSAVEDGSAHLGYAMDDTAKAIKRFVRDEAELEDRMDAEARATAQALIQKYIGLDHKVMVMSDFYSALFRR